MRVRETIFSEANTPCHQLRIEKPSGEISEDYVTYAGTYRVKRIEDTAGSGFHKLRKCGKILPLNPVEILDKSVTYTPGSSSIEHDGRRWSGEWAGVFPYWGPDVPPISESTCSRMALDAANRAVSADFDVLTMLAELGSDVRTLQGALNRLGNLAMTIAREARAFRRDPLRRFAELWLYYRYAVMPIVYTAEDAAKAISRLSRRDDGSRMVIGTASEQEPFDDFDTLTAADGNVEYTSEFRTYGLRKYRGFAIAQLEPWMRAVQFNPLVTAWELTTFSFIIDWFVDVGSYVNALPHVISGSLTDIMWSTQTTSQRSVTTSGKAIPPWWGENGPYVAVEDIKQYIRTPTSLPFPPVFPDISIPRFVDLVALATGWMEQVNRALRVRR